MHKVAIDTLPSEPEGDADVDRRSLTDHLQTTDVAINYYRLNPGEAFVAGMHAHLDQEEVFYVIEGTVTFETVTDPTAETELVEVGAGEAVRFAPGDYQQGRNESDEQVTALAIGAPPDSIDGRVPKTCPVCGESQYLNTVLVDGRIKAQCPECESVHESGLH